MRAMAVATLLAVLGGCASTADRQPREFLDEQTAATITVVADPVIFVDTASQAMRIERERGLAAGTSRDYLELYGIDVNRMGAHRQFFVLQQWLGEKDAQNVAVLELRTGGETVTLRSTKEEPRTFGVSAPVAPGLSKSAQWWYFPTDTATLRKVAAAGALDATLAIGDKRMAYTLFSDGRAQLGELASALPGQ